MGGAKTRRLGCWLAILAASALIGWWLTYDPTPAYRYRLTVEVETPEGLRTGSSVIEVETSVASSFAIPSPGSVRWRARGEAVAVDLPGGETLFALLRSDNDIDWASRVMFMLAPEAPKTAPDPFQARFNEMLKLKGPIAVPRMWPRVANLPERSAYPMLVTFDNLADPSSVEQVDPSDFAVSFGEGVRLKRITVQLTDDLVTKDIVGRLPWLGRIQDMNLALEDFPEGFPVGDFSGLFRKPS